MFRSVIVTRPSWCTRLTLWCSLQLIVIVIVIIIIITSLPKVIWEEGRVVRHCRTRRLRRKVTFGYNGAPQIRPLPKVPLPGDRSANHKICLIPGPVRPMMPIGIRIRSAVFPQCTGQIDVRTDTRTDRSSTGKFDRYRPLRYESDIS